MWTAAPADEADPARQASVTGTGAPGPAAMHAERGQRLAELILAESRQTGQGRGSRLPTERQLAEELGVTRSSVRHALAVLEAQGRISREVGRGTFLRDLEPSPAHPPVANPPVANPSAPDAGAADFAPADVMTVRRLLEPPAMPLVVAWATAADLEEMDRCLAGGDQAASYEEAVLSLEPGDTLLLFTDGLIERRGDSIEDVLREFVAGLSPGYGTRPEAPNVTGADLTAATQADQILASAVSDTGDDACLVAVRIR